MSLVDSPSCWASCALFVLKKGSIITQKPCGVVNVHICGQIVQSMEYLVCKKRRKIERKVWCFNFVHTDCIQSIWCLIKYSCIGTSWEKALSPRWHTGKKFCCHTLTWWLWLVVIDKTVRALIRCTDRPALDNGFYQKSMNLNLHREQSKCNQDKKRTGTIIQ